MKTKKPRVLGDIDKLILDKMNNKIEETMKETIEDYMPKCKKCGGTMDVVKPIVEIPFEDGKYTLELHECINCGEREYL